MRKPRYTHPAAPLNYLHVSLNSNGSAQNHSLSVTLSKIQFLQQVEDSRVKREIKHKIFQKCIIKNLIENKIIAFIKT